MLLGLESNAQQLKIQRYANQEISCSNGILSDFSIYTKHRHTFEVALQYVAVDWLLLTLVTPHVAPVGLLAAAVD